MNLSDLTLTLEMHLAGTRSVFFVQVGSNDGVQGDPLHQLILRNRRWRGMFVEPVPFLFRRLVSNYHNADRFVFVNKAISVEAGRQTFYYVAEEAKTYLSGNLPFWYDQLGSFNRDHILKHLDGKLGPYIIEQEVETQTLPDLLDEHGVSQVDLLHIDTEGFDEQVLSQFDFVKYKPSVVFFEHLHLSQDEKASAAALLRSNGYTLSIYGTDTLALLSDQAR